MRNDVESNENIVNLRIEWAKQRILHALQA